jgi:DNA-binding NarL/FixJ family response regulator
VGAECLEWALESRQDHGIWGGLTEEERRSRKRRRVRAAGQQSETRRSAREVDELTVQHLMDGVTVPGATRTDRLEAAVRLVCGGAENEPTAERLNVCSATVRNRVRELQGQNPRAAR